MFDDLVSRLTERIALEYCVENVNARTKAEELCTNCPEQLMLNVQQYANGSHLTDIYVGDYSIPMIMTIWGNRDFVGAMTVITEYINGNTDIAERRIWRTLR